MNEEVKKNSQELLDRMVKLLQQYKPQESVVCLWSICGAFIASQNLSEIDELLEGFCEYIKKAAYTHKEMLEHAKKSEGENENS